MKILTPPESDQWKYWWAGGKQTCFNCGTVLELQKEDKPISCHASGTTQETAKFACAECYKEFTVARHPECVFGRSY